MGRRNQRKHRQEKNGQYDKTDNNGWTKENTKYDVIVKENAMFEKYYRQLEICKTKEEFDEMLSFLQLPLPITFRITQYKSFASEITRILKEKHFKYLDTVCNADQGELIAASGCISSSLLKEADKTSAQKSDGKIYEQLSWYPGETAWKILLSRNDVRKNHHFEKFKLFLMHQTENGNLNRQEAVSMIPPLLLDVKSHHKILDMCASPGSKTAQLIEMLHADASNPTPEGFVIANDLDNKRCYMLMHQLKRLESPNFMIINHDASTMPNLRGDGFGNIMYDRILADVPCSGDGTFRKNVDVWAKWNFAHSCNLHGIQQRIGNRAVELLKPGGVMVYSTCSMNPIENEAVVANLLQKFKGQLELVDAREKLPGLKSLPGLYTWNVMTKTGELFNTYEEVEKTSYINIFRPGMFPPELSVAKEMGLEKCIRILPHYQNTGGFFIAVLKKLPKEEKEAKTPETETVKETEENKETENKIPGDDYSPPEADLKKQMKMPPAKRLKHVYEENPFKFIDTNEALLRDWPKIKHFFQINEDFPQKQMLTRNKPGENVRTIYFVSKEIRELVIQNGDRIKFINMGVPLFARADIKDPANVELRVSQESLDIVQKYFNCRTVHIKQYEDIVKILSQSTPLVTDLSEEMQAQIKKSSQNQNGSLVLVWKDEKKNDEEKHLPISFTAWLGKVSLRPFIKIEWRKFFLTMLDMEPAAIEEICARIKLEDKINSEKSLATNPQSRVYKDMGLPVDKAGHDGEAKTEENDQKSESMETEEKQ